MVKLDYERLKAIRLEQDITQKELAQSTGVSLSTIKQIETGRSSTDLVIRSLRMVFLVPLSSVWIA